MKTEAYLGFQDEFLCSRLDDKNSRSQKVARLEKAFEISSFVLVRSTHDLSTRRDDKRRQTVWVNNGRQNVYIALGTHWQ